MGVLRPDLIIKNVVPVIMAGIIGIYGLVVAVLVSDGCTSSFKVLPWLLLPLVPLCEIKYSPFVSTLYIQ